MIAFLDYSIKSALVLTLLYLPYTLMLRHERFFRMNRMTLLTILMLALVLPLCDFHSLAIDSQPTVYEVRHQMMRIVQDAETSLTSDSPESTALPFSWLRMFALVYAIGFILVVLIRLWQLVRIRQQICGGCLWKDKSDVATVYCHIDDVAPYSWMQSIVISENDYEPYGQVILLHEKAHILCRHSLDILLLTLVEAIQWWNPMAYMLGNNLRDVHEYEADDFVLHEGVSISCYQSLLVRKALANTSYAFANNFNHSLIKKRIYMMNHPKSNPWMRSKVLYLMPLTLVLLCAFATPKMNETVENVVTRNAAGTFVPNSTVDEKSVSDSAEELPLPTEESPVEDIAKDEVSDISEQEDSLDAAITFGAHTLVDSTLILYDANVKKPAKKQYVTTDRFELEGLVTPGLWDVAYLVRFYDDNGLLIQEPALRVPVNDNHFSISMNMDKPIIAQLQAIFKDSTLCTGVMEMYFKPGHKLNLTVMNGHFDTVEYPIFEKRIIE